MDRPRICLTPNSGDDGLLQEVQYGLDDIWKKELTFLKILFLRLLFAYITATFLIAPAYAQPSNPQ